MSPEKSPSRLKQVLRTLLKVFVSGAIAVWFAYTVDVEQLKTFFVRADWPTVALVVVIAIARIPVGAWRFQKLLDSVKRVKLWTLAEQIFIGFTYNNVLPSAVGGDAVRVIMLVPHGVTKTQSGMLIFAERVMGLWALWVMCLIALPFAGLNGTPLYIVAATVSVTIFLSVVIVWMVIKAPDKVFHFKFLIECRAIGQEILRRRRAFALSMLGSWLFQWSAIFSCWLISEAFGLNIPQSALYTLVPMVYFATLFPVSFGGVGLREMAFVYLFGSIGIGKEASLILGLGFYLTLIAPGALGALLQLKRLLLTRHQKDARLERTASIS